MFERLKAWLKARKAKPLDELLAVEFDDEDIRVVALEGMSPDWNQSLKWASIKRVCWKDGGLWGSDLVYLSQIQPDIVVTIPTEARGGHEFFGALCNRGLFPELIWRRALGDTSGGLHCWPPTEK